MPVHFATKIMGYLPIPIATSSLWEAMPTASPMYIATNQKIRLIILMLIMMGLLSAPCGSDKFSLNGGIEFSVKELERFAGGYHQRHSSKT